MNRSARKARTSALAVVALALSAVAVVGASGPGAATSALSQQATQLPLPNGATNPRINDVSCGGPGFCVGVGSYQSGGATPEGLIETWSGGQWTASTSPVPAGAPGGGALGGVSCTGSTCVAWGQYVTGPSTSAYMADVLSGGTWTSAPITPPSGTFPSGGFGADGPITGGGCFGPGSCIVVGNYFTAGNAARGWVAAYSSGAWQPARETVVPPDATPQASALTAVSCGGGLCQAVGEYVNSVGFQSLEVSINPGGAMNSPFAGALPTGATQSDGGLAGISCDSGGSCTGFGLYRTTGGSNSEAYVVPIGGTGFQPQQPPTPTPQSTTAFPAAHLVAASCVSGDCIVTGYYQDAAAAYHPLIDRFTGGHWVSDTAPTGADPSNPPYPNSVACASPSFCVALDTSSATQPADVFTGSAWSTLAVTEPTGSTGTADYPATPLACDSATTCWAVGDYATAAGTEVFADMISTGSGPNPTPSPSTTPTPGGGAVTPAQVAAWFHAALVPSGAAAHIKKLLHAHGLAVTVTTGQAGRVRVVWVAAVAAGHRKKIVVIALANAAVPGSGSATIRIALTPAGRRLLGGAHKVAVGTALVFTPATGQPVAVAGHAVLRP